MTVPSDDSVDALTANLNGGLYRELATFNQLFYLLSWTVLHMLLNIVVSFFHYMSLVFPRITFCDRWMQCGKCYPVQTKILSTDMSRTVRLSRLKSRGTPNLL